MPDLMEHMYCAQQINIPPNLPFILKQYAKAAIRTQPYDLLYWSAAYFRAKANNSPPPVKERLEYPPFDSPSRLSPGFLKVLHKQLGENEYVQSEILYEKWLGVCLVKEALNSMLKIGTFTNKVPWLKFVAIAAGHLCPSLSKTMVMICEIVTEEPDGGSAMIPVEVFVNLYQFLARLECGPPSPHALATDEPVASISASSVSQASSYTKQEESVTKVAEVSAKDSSAGLMVWEDVKPTEEQMADKRVRTPRHTEELGASSEVGLEVLNDAEGPHTELVTLYSAQEHAQLEMTVPSKGPSTDHLPKTDGSILSHTSLKENNDWIKIEPQKLDTLIQKQENEDELTTVDEQPTDNVGLADSTSEVEEHIQLVSEEKLDEAALEEEPNTTADRDAEEITTEISKSSDEITDKSKSDHKPISDAEQSAATFPSSAKVKSDAKADSGVEMTESTGVVEAKPSESSFFELEESVTMEEFVDNGENISKATCSSSEIRKGKTGNRSIDQIERDSSENTLRAAETEYNVMAVQDESSEFISHEREGEVSTKLESRMLSDKTSSSSFIVLPPEDVWQHVPGIGPVIPEPQILAVLEYMQYWAAKQHGMVMPRNINHMLCPPLDLPPTTDDNEDHNSN